MAALKYQVPKETLKKSVSIATFKKDGIGDDKKNIRAEMLIEHLNRLQIRFAIVDSNPSMEIFVEVESLED